MSSYPEFMADQDNQQEEKGEEGKSYEPMGMWAFQSREDIKPLQPPRNGFSEILLICLQLSISIPKPPSLVKSERNHKEDEEKYLFNYLLLFNYKNTVIEARRMRWCGWYAVTKLG